MAAQGKYIMVENFSDFGQDQKPTIYLKRVIDGRTEHVWKQTFSDWTQKDATFERLYAHQDKWSAWGDTFVNRGMHAFLDEITPYFIETDDIYHSDEPVQKGGRQCIFLARGDEDNPLIIMVDTTGESPRKIAELVCNDIQTRDWALEWLIRQLNRSATFFHILEEDGERALEKFLQLIIKRFRPDGANADGSQGAVPATRP